MATQYYPALSSILSTEYIPEELNFISTGLNELFDNVHFKDLIIEKSADGVATTYKMDIVSYSKLLRLEIPSTGLVLVLNPDLEQPNTSFSVIPISLTWSWGIKKYFRDFRFNSFSFSVEAFYKTIFNLTDISEKELLLSILDTPVEYSDALDQFVVDTNAKYPTLNIPYPINTDQEIALSETILAFNQSTDISFYDVVFNDYVDNSNNVNDAIEKVIQLFSSQLGTDIVGSIKELLVPKISASLHLSAGLEIPRSVLLPIKANGELELDETVKTTLLFDAGELVFNTKGGFGFNETMSLSFPPSHPRAQIGNTGLSIGFTKAKLDLNRYSNIPEATIAGYPVDFIGLYVELATIGFNNFGIESPNKTSAQITAENLLIGTGGIAGKISLEANGLLYRDFGSFSAELNLFALEFKMGSIISSDIKGKISIDRFTQGNSPALIDIEAHIRDNGNFDITASSQDITPIKFGNVFEITIKSLAFGKEERGYYAQVAGTLDFLVNIPVLGDILPKGIEVRKLRIWENGDLEFEGGGLTLPKSFHLKIGPVNLEVTNIATGGYRKEHNGVERRYRYFSFDGMLNTGRAGINTTGNGIKFYFTIDDDENKAFHCFLSIDKITIDMTIPGNVSKDEAIFILNGSLTMGNPDPAVIGTKAATEYSGAVSFSMPRLHMAGSAGMRLDPTTPAFIVDIGLEFSTPILLGATGLGIYGFRGLIGQHYKPSKTAAGLSESASWWDYYKAKKPKEGVGIDKFANEPGYAVGAGASIATSLDSGRVFSSKLFLLLGLPDLFLLQGQAGILRSRIGLDDQSDPPFSALIVIDRNSFQANLGVNYHLPEGGSFDGALFSLSGTMELAFFFNNASGWYLNLGKDQPESARIRARILTLFQGYAYLMISSRGFRAGAGARFDFEKKIGPVRVGLGAWIDLGGSISFKPVQIGAFIQVGGYAYLTIFRKGITLSVQVGLAVEAPHPFIIQGGLTVRIKILFIKINVNISLTWRINNDNSPLLAQQPVLQLPGVNPGYIPVTASNILSGDIFPVNYVTYELNDGNINIPRPGEAGWYINFLDPESAKQVTIPLDSFIDIDLLKPVRPMSPKIGGAGNQLPDGYVEWLPPQKGLSDQIKHQFEFTDLNIYSYDESSGSWKPYNIYEAVTAIVEENTGPDAINLSSLKDGYWQFAQPNLYNKIRLMSQNMFSFANQTTNAISDLDGANFRRKDLFCYEQVSKQGIINWANVALGTMYTNQSSFLNKTFSFTLQNVDGTVAFDPVYDKNCLAIGTKEGRLIIEFPEPLSNIKIDFGDNANNIRIDFVKINYVAEPTARLISRFTRITKVEKYLSPVFISDTTNHTSAIYTDPDQAINRIEINFLGNGSLDFNGDLVLGGYFKLPDEYAILPKIPFGHEEEQTKALLFAGFYAKAFTAQKVVAKNYKDATGAIAQWPLKNTNDTLNGHDGILLGSPDIQEGYFERNTANIEELQEVLQYVSNNDAVLIQFNEDLKIEKGNFAFEMVALFDPYVAGISTLLSKVQVDTLTGNRKGYTLHLVQDTPADSGKVYSTDTLPSFGIYFTCYNGTSHTCFKSSEKYTVNCKTGSAETVGDFTEMDFMPADFLVGDTGVNNEIRQKQYAHILVSVNRETDQLAVFIDKILKINVAVPAELNLFEQDSKNTVLNQLSYLTAGLQRRQEENGTSKEKLIEEVKLLGDGLNRTIQPIWRPNTTFALAVKTRDVVRDANTPNKVQIFGFKTAGPIGHFQQQSAVYQKLEAQDRTGEFKLANLKYYIDYERSFPDAQSRYDLSKPVFCADPQIKLLFIKPYINAMYENWDSYQGLSGIQSSLELQLIDTFGTTFSPQLVWEQLPDKPITFDNFQSLPIDHQILFLMNMAATADNCNESPLVVKKRSKQGAYHLPNLDPNKLYTAIFHARYQPAGTTAQSNEVHRYHFISSRFSSFEEQAKSFILDETQGQEKFAVYPVQLNFTAVEIDQNLKILLDDDLNNDPETVQRYAVKYDRMVYGGLALKNLDAFDHTIINVIVNTDPETGIQRILAMLIRNPEPFNDPKLPLDLLQNTIGLELKLENDSTLENDEFIYVHSRNTSAVLITNAAMDMEKGTAQLHFRYKVFNGEDYNTEHEDYTSPAFVFSATI